MKRNAYSLILMDDVVAAVDRLAAQQGTSRSNLINQILEFRKTETQNKKFRCHAFDSGFGTVQVPSHHSL